MGKHKSGFVNIIGLPNVGKSTLMNALLGEKLSVITKKAQTTRHRIHGIYSREDYQIVFSDTPGYIEKPAYKMQEEMNKYVRSTFDDADLFLYLTELGATLDKQADLYTPI
ncbi:MAG: GTP-binding protein Era, partial [Chitinophagales bacterium]